MRTALRNCDLHWQTLACFLSPSTTSAGCRRAVLRTSLVQIPISRGNARYLPGAAHCLVGEGSAAIADQNERNLPKLDAPAELQEARRLAVPLTQRGRLPELSNPAATNCLDCTGARRWPSRHSKRAASRLGPQSTSPELSDRNQDT